MGLDCYTLCLWLAGSRQSQSGHGPFFLSSVRVTSSERGLRLEKRGKDWLGRLGWGLLVEGLRGCERHRM
jgi:hypothetical protein